MEGFADDVLGFDVVVGSAPIAKKSVAKKNLESKLVCFVKDLFNGVLGFHIRKGKDFGLIETPFIKSGCHNHDVLHAKSMDFTDFVAPIRALKLLQSRVPIFAFCCVVMSEFKKSSVKFSLHKRLQSFLWQL